MSNRNRVIWSEGLFLRPQHFQQQDRFIESYVEDRAGFLRSYAWGFTELAIDDDLLSVGKLAIARAKGVFPDGTPFDIPHRDAAPAPIEVADDLRDARVFLALPTRQPGAPEFSTGGQDTALARYSSRDYEVGDNSGISEGSALMQVGTLKTDLLTDKDQRGEYTCLGMAHIVERGADQRVVLDQGFFPSLLNVRASQRLSGFLNKLKGMLKNRGDSLANLVSGAGKGGVAEVADFMWLQSVNRYEPLIEHFTAAHLLHPEDLYRILLQIAGELATFAADGKRPDQFPAYDHEDPGRCFPPVIASLEQSLAMGPPARAMSLEVRQHDLGYWAAMNPDPSLIGPSMFVLSVHADMPSDDVRIRLPQQIKIGTVETVPELVASGLPGIPIAPLPVAPPQLPFHANNVYFQLEAASGEWDSLKTSPGFGIHVGGDFPGLRLELWAIRG